MRNYNPRGITGENIYPRFNPSISVADQPTTTTTTICAILVHGCVIAFSNFAVLLASMRSINVFTSYE